MKKKIFIIFIIAITLFFLWTSFLWKMFSHGFAGSNPYVETWDLKITEKKLVEIIKDIKHEHPELIVPDDSIVDNAENLSYRDQDFRFYYPDTKEIVHVFIDTEPDSTMMQFALFGYEDYKKESIPASDSLSIKLGIHYISIEKTTADWRLINKDFNYFENRAAINKFERLIIDRIKEKLHQ